MTKLLLPEALKMVKNRRGNGSKNTTIKLVLEMNEGIMNTETVLATLNAFLVASSTRGLIIVSDEVETGFENGPKWEEDKE
jgi:hypothetical protein